MSDSSSPAPAPGRDPLPRRTTPTWEMELLISGATVFSLLQVPRLMDQVYYALVPRLDAAYQPVATMPYLYLMTACLALILTFLLHLCVRGYWVALVGLVSVYPRGVDWDSLPWGPAFVKALRRHTPPPEDIIERYDNRASQVFGFGMGLAYLALGIALMVILVIALVVAMHELSGRRLGVNALLLGCMILFFAPYLLLYTIDSRLRARPARFPRLTGWLDCFFDRLLRFRFLHGTNYPLLLFSAHAGGHRGSIALASVLLVLISVAAIRLDGADPLRHLDGSDLFRAEAGDGRTLDPRRYADQRARLDNLRPSIHIPSERIEGDWLRLFIPLRPSHDSDALRRLCPQLADPDAATPDAVLDCMPQRFRLWLDDVPVSAPTFDYAHDPIQGLRGVVAMLDVRTLAPGRHVLKLEDGDVPDAAAPPSSDDTKTEQESAVLRIPFWR
ncbi:MAG: hypothetical protein WCY72_07300 [Lysobacteraceae bacterium]